MKHVPSFKSKSLPLALAKGSPVVAYQSSCWPPDSLSVCLSRELFYRGSPCPLPQTHSRSWASLLAAAILLRSRQFLRSLICKCHSPLSLLLRSISIPCYPAIPLFSPLSCFHGPGHIRSISSLSAPDSARGLWFYPLYSAVLSAVSQVSEQNRLGKTFSPDQQHP